MTTRIIIEVSGGVVTAVHADQGNVAVDILNHDSWEETTDAMSLHYFEGLSVQLEDMDHIA